MQKTRTWRKFICGSALKLAHLRPADRESKAGLGNVSGPATISPSRSRQIEYAAAERFLCALSAPNPEVAGLRRRSQLASGIARLRLPLANQKQFLTRQPSQARLRRPLLAVGRIVKRLCLGKPGRTPRQAFTNEWNFAPSTTRSI